MMNHEHYTYRVTWSEDDKEYVGLCTEFPSLSHLDETPVAAMEGVLKLVQDIVEDMAENGEKIPKPLAERSYSGKFMVRVPPSQHRKIVTEAAEQGVSINRYVSAKLTS